MASDGTPRLAAFSDNKGAMSTDWDKYSTPEETRQRGMHILQDVCAVIRLPVGGIRSLGQSVDHDPLPENQAHTNVTGDKRDPEVRVKLQRLSAVVLPIESS